MYILLTRIAWVCFFNVLNVDYSTPANRIVLLGASNLTLSLRLIIQLVQHYCGAPSEVLVAAGHGRSYGQYTRVLMRELPGIMHCGLWRRLHAARSGTPTATYAFLTDVGNDIPYEAEPEHILNWVTWCVDQLQQHDARIVLTNLPIASIAALPETRFKVLRTVLFPACRLSRDEVIARTRAVHRGLIDLADRRGLVVCELEPEWMSFDGIHVAYCQRHALYRSLLKRFAYFAEQDGVQRGESLTQSISGTQFMQRSAHNEIILPWQQRPRFAVSRLFGKVRRAPQPSGFFEDRTNVALY